jgi:Zn-dependent protease
MGTAFDIGIYVHWTFLLLPIYLILTAGSSPVLSLMAFVAAVFGCVVLHELGHALTARRFGIETRDITLYPIGGVARLERMSEQPWEEFWIAIAGPAVNVVIAAMLAVGLFAAPYLTDFVTPMEVFAEHLLIANLMLIGFNLLPAFPMDGGRVLRAILSHRLGRVRATKIAADVATVFAVGMFLIALLGGHPFLMLGAVFVFFAGRQELAAVRYKDHLDQNGPLESRSVDDGELNITSAPQYPGFSGFTWDHRARAWILWRNGRPVQAVSTK